MLTKHRAAMRSLEEIISLVEQTARNKASHRDIAHEINTQASPDPYSVEAMMDYAVQATMCQMLDLNVKDLHNILVDLRAVLAAQRKITDKVASNG